ncbi:hypothetical protein ElyMa_005224300 [Elysia marginata]|uniref:Uncharacterized protein n=1 Tax=Elysia marginata TaxID=1093978 RepID=A0AAV4JXC3_9GAST|nr:hypothetical protein ElyMa_005224300 [Elysia marginata]
MLYLSMFQMKSTTVLLVLHVLAVCSTTSLSIQRGRAPARGLFQRLPFYDEEPNSLGDILELDEYPGVISYGDRPWELLELLNAENKRGALTPTDANKDLSDAVRQKNALNRRPGKK